jgi:HEAT repeat protein
MMASADAEARVKALEAFASWGAAEAFDHAASALDDPYPAIRRGALSAVASIDVQRCLDPLVEALGDEDRLVRQAAADALGDVGLAALEPVIAALGDPTLAEGALLALLNLPAHRAADSIRAYTLDQVSSAVHYADLRRDVQAARSEDQRMLLLSDSLRATALRHADLALCAVSSLGDRDAIALASDNLVTSDSNQRANALEILDSIPERRLIRPLLSLWEESHGGSARPLPSEEAIPILGARLQQVMQDEDAWLRACAVLAAGAILNETLQTGLAGSEPPDREQYAGTQDACELRTELTRLAHADADPTVREAAVVSLNGGVALETIPMLSVMERILFLRRVPLFADLPPAELQQVAGITGELAFPDETVITQQGDVGDEMYLIVDGEVRVVTRTEEGIETELGRRKSGDYVGEMAIISREPRMASLVAAGDVRLLYIDQRSFEGILRERPETSLAVMRQLCGRLRERESDRQPN